MSQEFLTIVHQGEELAARGARVAVNPCTTATGGVIHALAGDGDKLVVVYHHVDEIAAGCACISTNPCASAVGGVVYLVGFLWVDAHNFVGGLHHSSVLCLDSLSAKEQSQK